MRPLRWRPPTVDTSCFCLTLRNGCFVISVLQMILGVLTMAAMIRRHNAVPRLGNHEDLTTFEGLLQIAYGLLLCMGVLRNVKFSILIWLIVNGQIIVCYPFILWGMDAMGDLLAIIQLVPWVYWWIVVYSFYEKDLPFTPPASPDFGTAASAHYATSAMTEDGNINMKTTV